MNSIHLVNMLLTGVLAVVAFHTYQEVSRRRARNLSKTFREEARSRLAEIIKDSAGNDPHVTRFAEILVRVLSSHRSMESGARKQLEFLELDRSAREEITQRAKSFKNSFDASWQARFAEVFPYLETACLLHDDYLGPEIAKFLRKTYSVMEDSSRDQVVVRVSRTVPARPPQAREIPLTLGRAEAIYGAACAV